VKTTINNLFKNVDNVRQYCDTVNMNEKSNEYTITILQPMKTNALFSNPQRRLAVSQY